MTIEELEKEESRILKMLEQAVPGTTEYQNLKNDLLDIQKARVEMQKLDDSKADQNWKHELDEERVYADRLEAELKSKDARRHDILDICKVGLAILGSLAGIILTGHLEDTQILSQKAFSWINKPKY